MDEFNTIFIFTDKARAVWPGFEMVVIGLLAILATSIWALHSLWLVVLKNNLKRINQVVLALILICSEIGLTKQGYEETQYYQNEFSHLQKLYDSQNYEVVEGTVHVVKAAPLGKQDIVQIDDIEFSISCYDILLFTYSKARDCGGVLTEGVYARVLYYKDESVFSTPIQYPNILRVDIKN